MRLKNVKTGALTNVPADSVFIAISHAPATDLVAGQIKLTFRLCRVAPIPRPRRSPACSPPATWRRNLPAGGHGRRPWLHGGP
jgi:hypothetical protein